MEAVEAPPRKKRSPRKDSESSHSYPLPTFRPFQLCTLTDAIPTGINWLFEMKFDGYRAQIAVSGSEVRANAFDIFSAAERAAGSHAWEGYFETEQTLTEHIQDVVRNR